LQGFGGPVPPLATYTVQVSGAPSVPLAHPQVALVWGMQWLTEPLCILPPENQPAAAVLAAGCRDPFGFVPLRVETNVPTDLTTTTVELYTLPGADVMVGDLTARVAYGSFVLYDDRDDDGLLTLARPNRLGVPTEGPGMETGPTDQTDIVYGASFVTMTAPDQRVGYREGAFVQSAFYPRAGCGDPPPAFSALAASGFSAFDAIQATLAGMLPQEQDLSQCVQAAPADQAITVPVEVPANVAEVACTENNADSSVRYREPPADAPDFTNRLYACVHLPTFDGTTSPTIELIVSGRTEDACVGITHYILKGCREDPNCGTPDWDDAPPNWWPQQCI
jgi:hypothetical protein